MHEEKTRNRQWLTTLLVVLLSVSLMALAAGCGRGGQEPAAETVPTVVPTIAAATEAPTEPAPTEEPTAEPTEAPTEAPPPQSRLDTMEHTVDPMLVNVTWEWVSRDPNGNQIDEITVPTPENFTLLFNEDGTFSAKVDCNNAAGAYATGNVENDQKSIFMELGPMQMAFCGEESLDQSMMETFGPAQNYHFEDDGNTLVFDWVAAGPIDTYRKAGAPGADTGAGEYDAVLANLTYQSEFTQDGTAPLVDGVYEEEAAPGSATKTTVTLLPEYTAVGELNGQPAAAVILATDPGGSGTFVDLAVVTELDGEPTNVAITSLGDRVQVNSVVIENNQINGRYGHARTGRPHVLPHPGSGADLRVAG